MIDSPRTLRDKRGFLIEVEAKGYLKKLQLDELDILPYNLPIICKIIVMLRINALVKN